VFPRNAVVLWIFYPRICRHWWFCYSICCFRKFFVVYLSNHGSSPLVPLSSTPHLLSLHRWCVRLVASEFAVWEGFRTNTGSQREGSTHTWPRISFCLFNTCIVQLMQSLFTFMFFASLVLPSVVIGNTPSARFFVDITGCVMNCTIVVVSFTGSVAVLKSLAENIADHPFRSWCYYWQRWRRPM